MIRFLLVMPLLLVGLAILVWPLYVLPDRDLSVAVWLGYAIIVCAVADRWPRRY